MTLLRQLALASLFLGSAGCLLQDGSPDLGPCSNPPDTLAWEFGQVEIGTCLAAPSDLVVRPDPLDPDNYFLFVVNSNGANTFTGSSVMSIDASSIDLSCPVNGMHEVDLSVLPMQEFAGRVGFSDPEGLALVSRRYNAGQDGNLTDIVYTIDASDPRNLTWSDRGPQSWGPYRFVQVPADPWTVRVNPVDGRAWLLSLKTHLVSALDLVSDPLSFVDLHAQRSVGAARFVDADGSGSAPDFRLLGVNDDFLYDEELAIRYVDGTTRMLRAEEQDGGAVLRSADAGDGLTFSDQPGPPLVGPDADWAAGGLRSAAVVVQDAVLLGVVEAVDAGGERSLGIMEAVADATDWGLDEERLFGDGGLGLGDPALLLLDTTAHLWFTAGDWAASEIGHAQGSSLGELERGAAALSPDTAGWDSASVGAPTVLWQESSGQYLMYYAGHAGLDQGVPLGSGIGLARSTDGQTFARSTQGAGGGSLVLAPGEAGQWDSVAVAAPSVLVDNGRFVLWYQGFDGATWGLGRAVSGDGVHWQRDAANPIAEGIVFDGRPARVFVDKVSEGGYYRLVGPLSGSPLAVAMEGENFESPSSPLHFEIVGGQALGRGQPGSYDADGAASGSSDGVRVVYEARRGSARRLAVAHDLGAGMERVGTVTLAGFTGDAGGLVGDDPTISAQRPQLAADGRVFFDDGIRLYAASFTADTQAEAVGGGGALLELGEAGSFDDVAQVAPSFVAGPGDDGWLFFEAQDGELSRIALARGTPDAGFSAPAVTLDRGAAGGWEDAGVSAPTVLWDASRQRFLMWYLGFDGDQRRVGFAPGAVDGDAVTWTRHVVDGVGSPVFDGAALGYAADGVARPSVRDTGEGYEMLFEAVLDGVSRVGRAVSPDGVAWTTVSNPTTAGDYFTVRTRPGDDDPSTSIDLGDDRHHPRIVDGVLIHGAGVTDMVLSPDGHFAVVSNKRAPYLLVLDLHDDSDGDYVDANYGDIEAVISLRQRSGMSAGRALHFTEDGSELWMTLAPLVIPGSSDDSAKRGPEGLLRVDWSQVHDEAAARILRDDVITAFLPTARGVERDDGYNTDVSVGPGAFALNTAADRAYVSNFNDNSLYVIDLRAGARGAVKTIVRGLDENPFEVALSPDERLLYVINSYGERRDNASHSTLQIVDVDEDSPTFGHVLTTLSNLRGRAEAGCE